MDKMARLVEEFEKSFDRFMSRITLFVQNDRRYQVVIKAIGKLVAVGVTIYVVWYEFPLLSEHVNFLMLLMTWVMYGVLAFIIDIRQSKEKPIGEKIDDLIAEIKVDREQMHNELEKLINEIRQDRNERNNKSG